jgi:hypothetical protein
MGVGGCAQASAPAELFSRRAAVVAGAVGSLVMEGSD